MTSPSVPRSNIEPWRALVFYVVLGAAFAAVVLRLFVLQVIEYPEWFAQAEENRTRSISIPPQRGIIYDRNGSILASNVASYNIVITPANLPDDQADIQEIYRQLSTLTGIPVNNGTVDDAKLVSACVPGPGIAQLVELQDTNAPYSAVKIQCNITEERARIVREKAVDWPGVSVEIEPIRNYPTGSLTSNIIGFLGPIPASLEEVYRSQGFLPNRDKVGYSGVESYFQDLIAGTPGSRVVEVDVAGQEIRNLQPPVAPEPGNNLVLTIDTRLQKAAEAALVGEINGWNAYYGRIRISSGAAIAINPKTGEILAMVSYPTYENNRMARIIPAYYYNQLSEDPRKPLLNHAIADEHPPGSVFKLSTATGSLNEGVVSLNQVIDAPGELVLLESFSPNDPGREQRFVDWNEAGFGTITFLRCIAYSSNVCFYKLGGGYRTEVPQGLGIERLREYARALGYDRPSGVELLGEGDGLIPYPQWKRINRGENWSTGDTYIASVGQGYVTSTPLQVLLSAATLSNDGVQMQPTIIREVTDSSGKTVTLWRDIVGNFYRPCTIPGVQGGGQSGWCDVNPAAANVYFRICEGPDPNNEGRIIPGFCSADDLAGEDFRAGAWQVSPFTGNVRWDITRDLLITDYQCDGPFCVSTDTKKNVRPDVVQRIQEGMRLAITDDRGTLHDIFNGNTQQFTTPFPIAVAGKTGTAEYCDNVAQAQNLCNFGSWPTHSWTTAFAPYDDPEIAVVAFAYNGGEGASVAGPIVRLIMEAYFELKAIDAAQTAPVTP